MSAGDLTSRVTARVERLVGARVRDARPVGGGSICDAYRVDVDSGSSLFVKTLDPAPQRFFEVEAEAVRWLAVPGGAPLPEVLAVEAGLLALTWVEPGRPTPEAAERLGRGLAATHRAGAPAFGADRDGFIGPLPLPNTAARYWPAFYAEQRLHPYLRRAVDRGALETSDRQAVEQVCDRLPDLAGTGEEPARLHGDLWSGNVLWAADGRARLVDPAAASGGHRETDLAMLALFGAPHLDRLRAAYDEAYPLADGWEARVPLHQLHPLLVHAALFGGGYGAQAGAAARRALAAR